MRGGAGDVIGDRDSVVVVVVVGGGTGGGGGGGGGENDDDGGDNAVSDSAGNSAIGWCGTGDEDGCGDCDDGDGGCW